MANPASYDSITGKPIFGNDISNPASQFQANADYAELQGPQSVALFTDLAAVPNKRPNMRRLVRATQTEYVYLNSDLGWVSDEDPGVQGPLANYTTTGQADIGNTGTNQLARNLTFTSPRPRRVLVVCNYAWFAAANAAGLDQLRIGGATEGTSTALMPAIRQENSGSTTRQPVTLTATAFLPAAVTNISLFATADAAGVLRSLKNINISIYAV